MRAVERTIDILQTFTFEQTEMSLAQLCAEVGLPKTTVFRILSTLEGRNFVVQDHQTGKYRLSYEAIKIGAIAQEGNTLGKIAREDMEEITRATGQTCNIYIRDGFSRMCIAQVAGTQYIRRYSFLGARHPLHCGAGKLLLAYAGKAFQEEFFRSANLERYTENTVTDPAQLKQELDEIVRVGYSITRGERDPNTAMASVPLFDYTQRAVASITLSGPIYFLTDENVGQYLEQLKQSSAKISHKLGFRSSLAVLVD